MALYADHERGRYPVWQSLDHPNFFPGSGILFVTVTGEFSKRIESLPDSHVRDEVLSVLRSMYPNVPVPEPLDFYFQRWHSDALFRGSYSNWPASFLSEHQGNLRANVDERLWFAGEATSRKYFGAWLISKCIDKRLVLRTYRISARCVLRRRGNWAHSCGMR